MNEGASLLTTAQLKERGWTPALVKKFLDPPDATKPNPHYRSASPRRFSAKVAQRSEVGKAVAARKAAELVKEAEHLPITVTRLPLDQLQSCASVSYNAFHEELLWERGHDYERASEQSDPAFLQRITVNHIRHHLTAYDKHLEEVAGRMGVDKATALIRKPGLC